MILVVSQPIPFSKIKEGSYQKWKRKITWLRNSPDMISSKIYFAWI